MPTLSNLLALLSLDDSPFLEALDSSQAATNTFAQNLVNVGGAVVVGTLTTAAAAITAVGAAAWDAGNTMDDAMDTISASTGAVGPELEGLRQDFEAVFTSVPTGAGDAATAIGILNSRLDASGPALQNLARPLLEVTRLLDGDITTNAENFTRVMGDWNLPLDDATSYLDGLFVAAQKTGAPLDQLMDRIVQYGAPMRNFGFNFNEAAAILASFEAQGVNTEIVMSGLRTAQGKFIAQGKDMNTGLWETIDAIQNAERSTEALGIATEIFGAKAAGDMFDTIRSGKFDVEGLVETIMNADGAIMDAGAATADWGEKWQVFKNKITTALAPVGSAMMDALGSAMDSVVEIFERPDVQAGIANFTMMIGNFISQAVTYIPVLIDGFFQFISFLQNNQGVVIGILAALGVAALAWGISTAIAAWTAMAPLLPVIAVIALIAGAAYLLYEAWTNNWGGIRDTLMNVWANLEPIFNAVREWLGVAIPAAVQFLADLWQNSLLPALQAVWAFLQESLFPLFAAIGNVISAVVVKAVEAWMGIFQNVTLPVLQQLWEWFDAKILPILQKVGEWIGKYVVWGFENLSNAIAKVVGWLSDLASMLNNISLPAWMTPGSPTPWEIGLRGVGKAMNDLSRSQLPTFSAALDLQAQPIGVSGSPIAFGNAVAGGAGGTVIQIDVRSDGVHDEKDIANKIGAAIDVHLRERGLV